MAITDNGIKIEVPAAIVPDDFTAPAYTEIADFEYKRVYQLNVLKATVENAVHATTFGNIINDAAIGILKQVLDLVTADFIGTNTVDYYTIWKDLNSNVNRNSSTDFLTDTGFNYVCTVEVYIKTS